MTYCTDTRVARGYGLATSIGRGFATAFSTVKLWYVRSKQRRYLLELDDYLLRDIGLDRITAMREAAKPFWRA